VIDPRAQRIAPRHAGIVGLQEFGRRSDIRPTGTEPQIAGIWIEEYVSVSIASQLQSQYAVSDAADDPRSLSLGTRA
jgi:hypothetical protein